MMFPKNKRTRLKGKPQSNLNDQIWNRDGGCCVLCGTPVSCGSKYHHIVYKSHGGGDTLDNGATLCINCHGKVHGVNSKEIRALLLNYVSKGDKDGLQYANP